MTKENDPLKRKDLHTARLMVMVTQLPLTYAGMSIPSEHKKLIAKVQRAEQLMHEVLLGIVDLLAVVNNEEK